MFFFLILCVTNDSLLSQNKTQTQRKTKNESSIKEINNKINIENKKKIPTVSIKTIKSKNRSTWALILNLENTMILK